MCCITWTRRNGRRCSPEIEAFRRAGAASDLPPGVRAAVQHADARRGRAARGRSRQRRQRRRGSRRCSASTSARSRSAGTWRRLAPDVRDVRDGGVLTSCRCTTGGSSDAHFVPLCPAVIRPSHCVAEQVVESQEETHQRRATARRALGMASHRFRHREPVDRAGGLAGDGRGRAGVDPAGGADALPETDLTHPADGSAGSSRPRR